MRLALYIAALAFLVAAVGAAHSGAHAWASLLMAVAIALAWVSCCEGEP